MADYEYLLACLMIPAAYVIIYIAGKYDIITLFLDVLAERLEAYNRKQDEEVHKEMHDMWIPCSGCKDCQHNECKHHGKV